MWVKSGGSLLSGFNYSGQLFLLDFICSIMLGILLFVVFLLVFMICSKSGGKLFVLNFSSVELLCGILPVVLLLMEVYCSYTSFMWDSFVEGDGGSDKKWLHVKIVGQQWFWTYEYQGLGSWMKFESYMLSNTDLDVGGLRLLDVDNRLYLPVSQLVLMSVTSSDVIHSWSLPSCGVKVDAIPGFLNSHILFFSNVGVFYGSCSEICGAGHSYMPIVVEVGSLMDWNYWVEDMKHKFDIITRLGDWYNLHGVSSFSA